jgi:hypothetical protein
MADENVIGVPEITAFSPDNELIPSLIIKFIIYSSFHG